VSDILKRTIALLTGLAYVLAEMPNDRSRLLPHYTTAEPSHVADDEPLLDLRPPLKLYFPAQEATPTQPMTGETARLYGAFLDARVKRK